MKYGEFIGKRVQMEPPLPMSCLVDCPFARADRQVCEEGPKVDAEITGLLFEPGDPVPRMLVAPVGYICMRDEQAPELPAPPAPQ
jgi:hypothetical protein